MKMKSVLMTLGLTVFVAGCATVQNLRPSLGRTSCEATNMSRAEYDAYQALGADKPYHCAINVPPAPRVTAEQG